MDLVNKKILLVGQVNTGRLEVMENFLKEQAKSFAIVGLDNPHAPRKAAFFKVYDSGSIVNKFNLPSIRIKKLSWYNISVILLIYICQFFSILLCSFYLRGKSDLHIGIGTFPSLVGILLRKLGKVNYSVYYSIDYFPYPIKFGFNRIFTKIFIILDRICVRKSDIVWNISSKIIQAREKMENLSPKNYRQILVPLGFNSNLLRFRKFKDIDRWMVVFVGTCGCFHGLQLLVDSIPHIVKRLPRIKVKIIGIGPWDSFKKYVRDKGLSDYFIFRGFISDEVDLFDTVSKCALGAAPYNLREDNPALYADPGKPKLYAFCGIPIVITKGPAVSEEIQRREAGISIAYDKKELAKAIIDILIDEERLQRYRKNAFEFAKDYIAEELFTRAFNQSLEIIRTKI